jgi:hypothetical protein
MTEKTASPAGAMPRAMFFASASLPPMLRGPQVAYAPDDGGSGGALTVEQAMEALHAPAEPEAPAPEEPEQPDVVEPEAEAPVEPESEGEPTPEEDPGPEEPATEDDPQGAEPESDPETPAIAAPQSWDAAERAEFAKLSRQAQEIILKRESERDRAVSKAQQEASTVRKQAEADLAQLAQTKAVFDQIATRANKVFADKWANVDWVALARQDPAAYTIAKAEHDAEAIEVQRVLQAQAEADRVSQQAQQTQFQSYVQAEFQRLAEIAPELAPDPRDPQKGAEKRGEVTKFLRGLGIPDDAIRQISAVEMVLAHEAMEFRKLKAKGASAAAAPKTPAKPATAKPSAPARAAAPSAAPPVRPTQQRNLDTAMSRLSKTGSTDDAVAVLRAMRGA